MEQEELFSTQNFAKPRWERRQDDYKMSHDQLIQWKQRIFNHQKDIPYQIPTQQNSLFETERISTADKINPFVLELHNWRFYRMPWINTKSCCLYFIVDLAWSLVLYIGETKRSAHERWGRNGYNHDCDSYIKSYIQLHRDYKLDVRVAASFYYDVPLETRERKKIESELIHKWRSPFNRENWKWWGQPFQK
ncbi:MAG: hypothetical protein ABEI32_00655 [Halothece sp.]